MAVSLTGVKQRGKGNRGKQKSLVDDRYRLSSKWLIEPWRQQVKDKTTHETVEIQDLANSTPIENPICGIVMPISSMEGYSVDHWQDVKAIIVDAIEAAGFKGRLVSDADEVSVIHKRIVTNLYEDPVVVVDTSCRNPNVMFELGMRLAFDKPTIVIQDDATDFSFDTSPIEHLRYSKDLGYRASQKLKQELKNKIIHTYEASKITGYTSFLAHFGTFELSGIEKKKITTENFILKKLEDIEDRIAESRNTKLSSNDFSENSRVDYFSTEGFTDSMMSELISFLNEKGFKSLAKIDNEEVLVSGLLTSRSRQEIQNKIDQILPF